MTIPANVAEKLKNFYWVKEEAKKYHLINWNVVKSLIKGLGFMEQRFAIVP